MGALAEQFCPLNTHLHFAALIDLQYGQRDTEHFAVDKLLSEQSIGKTGASQHHSQSRLTSPEWLLQGQDIIRGQC